ncbi:Dead/deah box RNA helicase, partial [Globisporangium polare]
AHSFLKTPVSRETSSRTDVDGTMGCPSNTPGQSTSFAPGATIDVRYPRNNHLGGFIRWAIVAKGKESKSAFDSAVFYYTCRESGSQCLPLGTNSVYAGDNGAAENAILCGDKIKLPDWLPAGDYVLQWTWMSAGSSYGHVAWANEIYRSCADIKLTTAGTGKKPSCPSFVGGDRVTKLGGKSSDQCFYFVSNDIVTTIFKGDDSNYQQYYK